MASYVDKTRDGVLDDFVDKYSVHRVNEFLNQLAISGIAGGIEDYFYGTMEDEGYDDETIQAQCDSIIHMIGQLLIKYSKK